jgi:CRP-like cAMP-binding protein
MEALPNSLQYGEKASYAAQDLIYAEGDPAGEKPIYYIIAGLIKVEYALSKSKFPLWLTPDSIFGLVEPLAETARLSQVRAMERTIIYRWDLDGFFSAAGVSWELGLTAITGLTRELRILNAEFGDRVAALP